LNQFTVKWVLLFSLSKRTKCFLVVPTIIGWLIFKE
jgi:hypothetical protein